MSRGSTGSDPAVDNSELRLSSCCLAPVARRPKMGTSMSAAVHWSCSSATQQTRAKTVKLSSVTERRNLMGGEYSGGREALVGSRLAADTVGPR